MLNLSALALGYLQRYRSVTYEQLYADLERRVGQKDSEDIRLMFGPTVSLLYVIGKVHYHPQNDTFEYLETHAP